MAISKEIAPTISKGSTIKINWQHSHKMWCHFLRKVEPSERFALIWSLPHGASHGEWKIYASHSGVPGKSNDFLGKGGATEWMSFSCLHGNEWYEVCDDASYTVTSRTFGRPNVKSAPSNQGGNFRGWPLIPHLKGWWYEKTRNTNICPHYSKGKRTYKQPC